MDNSALFEKVKALKLPNGKYALFGSAPMGVRGLKQCHDADLIVTEDIFEEYRNKTEWKCEISARGFEYLVNDDIELWKNWAPGEWDIQQLIEDSEILEGLPFVKLEAVSSWKALNGREKDLKDLETLKNFLNQK